MVPFVLWLSFEAFMLLACATMAQCVRLREGRVWRLVFAPLVLVYASVPLSCALMGGNLFLPPRFASAAVGLAAGGLLLAAYVLWWNWRATVLTREEFKRRNRARRWRYLGLYALMLLAPAGAYAWGLRSGRRALEATAVEARAILVRPRGKTAETAAEAYRAIFRAIKKDSGFEEISSVEPETWPTGAELTAFVAARAGRIARIEETACGPVPRFALESWDLAQVLGSRKEGRLYAGFRRSAILLNFAAEDAAMRGEAGRALALLETKLRLGGHAGTIPGITPNMLALACSAPEKGTLVAVLEAAGPGDRAALARYAAALSAARAGVGEAYARAVVADGARHVLWFSAMAENSPDLLGWDQEDLGRSVRWFLLPLYGRESCDRLLPRARAAAAALRKPFAEARREREALSSEKEFEGRTVGDFLLSFLTVGYDDFLKVRARCEQYHAALEAACALRLHRLDRGKYPAALGALAPAYLAADVLDPEGPAQLLYERRGDGCRLFWWPWELGSTRYTIRDGEWIEKESPLVEPGEEIEEIRLDLAPEPEPEPDEENAP